MKKQEEKKKTLGEVMREFRATFTVPFKDGFGSISFSDENELVVEFLNEEGYHFDGATPIALKDLHTITSFMAAMKALRLEEYKTV